VITLTRRQVVTLAVPLLALLVLAGSRLTSTGTTSARTSAPLKVVDSRSTRPPPIIVDVVGAVRRSGLYRLREGMRVADAVEKAGGPTAKADLTAINLAAPVVDGQQILVPSRVAATGAGGGGVLPGAGLKVSLSSATLEQLDALPGVGPVTAQKILDYRATHPLRSADDLDAIPGIGPARVEQLRDLVTP
jgi:competence protein ComEA